MLCNYLILELYAVEGCCPACHPAVSQKIFFFKVLRYYILIDVYIKFNSAFPIGNVGFPREMCIPMGTQDFPMENLTKILDNFLFWTTISSCFRSSTCMLRPLQYNMISVKKVLLRFYLSMLKLPFPEWQICPVDSLWLNVILNASTSLVENGQVYC